MKYKPETLQNRFIKEIFAKYRMSKALFVQKKIGYGRTDTQTDRQTDRSFYSLYGLGFHPSQIYIIYHINRSLLTL